MGKIAQVAAKYLVTASIEIDGTVDKPDMIGAIFGQTEGLLGSELELRELQRSGRIGRIEVSHEIKSGKTLGAITIPSSLDKAETAIVGAALEVIQRIGPCNARIKVTKIEDVRVSKRTQLIARAKELLRELMNSSMADSTELAQEVSEAVRVMEVVEYGAERLPAGPGIADSDEIIIVEGRADVVTLLKYGIKNTIALNGTSVPQGVIDICKEKTAIAFVDGDRGGDLILKELLAVAEVDFITKAPDGKEVEELQMKEIHKALRSKIPAEEAKEGLSHSKPLPRPHMSQDDRQERRPVRGERREERAEPSSSEERPRTTRLKMSDDEKESFKAMLSSQLGTHGASILDAEMNVLGKIPVSELVSTIKSLNSGIYAVVLDGVVDRDLAEAAERARVKYLIATESKVRPVKANVTILTDKDLV
ncbi:MAG TPA: DNA primase DnaG [Candidatus Nanoarchaeia archaeon]|nr:DNA primase DnaG [Candidatus Nanoarchaeia archaeon]